MVDLVELGKRLLENSPEAKKWYEETEKWREERKLEYIKQGIADDEANLKAWNDFWKDAKEEYGVEFSINKIK